MTDPTDTIGTAVSNINARIDLLSSQVLQLATIQGQSAERQQAQNREVITYVTGKIEELVTAVAEVRSPSNGQAATEPEAVRADGWLAREGNG